jgi:hypothetical protein
VGARPAAIDSGDSYVEDGMARPGRWRRVGPG